MSAAPGRSGGSQGGPHCREAAGVVVSHSAACAVHSPVAEAEGRVVSAVSALRGGSRDHSCGKLPEAHERKVTKIPIFNIIPFLCKSFYTP